MANNYKHFIEEEFVLKNKIYKYYLAPNLVKYNFKHGFFTKKSSEIDLLLISNKLNGNKNCILNQVHSNQIVLGSKTNIQNRLNADGIVSDKNKQILWIYTADCMPILFADKRQRYVAAIHCGRKGLEKKIIKKVIKMFNNLGTSRKDILVSIGPSISKKNYLLDKQTYKYFYHETFKDLSLGFIEDNKLLFNSNNNEELKKGEFVSLDIKKHAHIQLLNEKIPDINIDISLLCTFDSNKDFYSWRRSKTFSRQWNFIMS